MNLLRYALFAFSIFFVAACGDSNPFEAVREDVQDERAYARNHYSSSSMSEADKCYNGTSYKSDSYCCSNYGYRCSYVSSSSYMSESDKCYYGKSSYSDSWCCTNYGYRCSYVSSSSSYRYSSSSVKTEVTEAHTSKTKYMKLTLTYYEQTSSNWDFISAGGTYSDGDPKVSFTVHFIASGGQATTKTTSDFISLQDKGSWSGTKSETLEVPIGTQNIKICPSVIDKDEFSSDNKSSGYCYTKTNVGYLSNNVTVKQDDYYSTNYELEWEWYLY